MKLIAFISVVLLSFSVTEDIASGLQERANIQNKNIAVYFCGSDWCSVCHKFRRETLSIPEIDSLLHGDFVYYEADFPQKAKQSESLVAANEFLAERLNPAGEFPVLVIADANWKVLTRIYRGHPGQTVIQKLNQHKK